MHLVYMKQARFGVQSWVRDVGDITRQLTQQNRKRTLSPLLLTFTQFDKRKVRSIAPLDMVRPNGRKLFESAALDIVDVILRLLIDERRRLPSGRPVWVTTEATSCGEIAPRC